MNLSAALFNTFIETFYDGNIYGRGDKGKFYTCHKYVQYHDNW